MPNHNVPTRFVITVTIEPDGDGFHAYCPVLKGLHAEGKTVEEAAGNAKELAISYILSLLKHGDPIPIAAITPPTPTQNIWQLAFQRAVQKKQVQRELSFSV